MRLARHREAVRSPDDPHKTKRGTERGLISLRRQRGLSSGKRIMTLRRCHGFTLLETLIAIAFVLVITGIGFITLMPALNKAHVDSAYDTTLMVLRNTRHLAITQ